MQTVFSSVYCIIIFIVLINYTWATIQTQQQQFSYWQCDIKVMCFVLVGSNRERVVLIGCHSVEAVMIGYTAL